MVTIGITASEANFHNYEPWISGGDKAIEIIILSHEARNLKDLEICDGIVLSGGVDTHPKYYNNLRLDFPGAGTFIEERDIFELKVFEYARHHHIPVLAICRGMQLINIALGGDLIQDLEAHGKNNHRRTASEDGLHEIYVDKNSFLYSIVRIDKGIVNSSHHQGIGRIAHELISCAASEDDIAEAVEYREREGKAFLLGVQWHPERLDPGTANEAFSKNIRDAFINATTKKPDGHH